MSPYLGRGLILFRIRPRASKRIHRALSPPSTSVQDMGVNDGRLHVFMTEQFLNTSNIVPLFNQVCGEGVAEGVAGGTLRKPHLSYRILDAALHSRLVNAVAGLLSGSPGPPPLLSREDIVPSPCRGSIRVLAVASVAKRESLILFRDNTRRRDRRSTSCRAFSSRVR
jgi:hypothetical protein